MCPAFEFHDTQEIRRQKNHQCGYKIGDVLSDLDGGQCHSLKYFIEALEDTSTVLRPKTTNISGSVIAAKFFTNSNTWSIQVQLSDTITCIDLEVDCLILACGCVPIVPSIQQIVKTNVDEVIWKGCIHSLDRFVNTLAVKAELEKDKSIDDKWCVVGTSHSALLVMKNLIENGIQVNRIINIYKSRELRFQGYDSHGRLRYPGIGLKGPVGDWARQFLSFSEIERVRYKLREVTVMVTANTLCFCSYDASISWSELFIRHNVNHVIFAMGFERNHIQSMQPQTVDPLAASKYRIESSATGIDRDSLVIINDSSKGLSGTASGDEPSRPSYVSNKIFGTMEDSSNECIHKDVRMHEEPFPSISIYDHTLSADDYDSYDIRTGEICGSSDHLHHFPRSILFGIGIAFPQHFSTRTVDQSLG